VEPDVELVELCAASMDTEKHNAAALVSSFFMVFLLLVVRHNLPTTWEMRAVGAGLPKLSGKDLGTLELVKNQWLDGTKI
jgi:hypothetical protein